MDSNKIIVHDPPKKVLWKFILRASSVEEAKRILQKAYPGLDVEKNFIYGEVVKEMKQGNLF